MPRPIQCEVPEEVYEDLTWTQQQLGFASLQELIVQALQRRIAEAKHEAWLSDLRELQRDIRLSGDASLAVSKDEVISRLRSQRQELFGETYADLY